MDAFVVSYMTFQIHVSKHLILHDVIHISPKGKSVNGFLAKHLK